MLKLIRNSLLLLLTVVMVTAVTGCNATSKKETLSTQEANEKQAVASTHVQDKENEVIEQKKKEATKETNSKIESEQKASTENNVNEKKQKQTKQVNQASNEKKNTNSTSSTNKQQKQIISKKPVEKEEEKNIIIFSIIGDKEVGTIFSKSQVEYKEGDSVLDVLKRVTRGHKIQMEYTGFKATAYVQGIDNLYEFDRGGKSGWMYRVNAVFPNVSAGAYHLKKGDKVEWLYTLDLGKDLGATYK
ncbi:DUF4430 domain-containing protein [Bacillus sp. EAC]|uniref:DUF4430 domain-containing protein n=1 Tax=Bacillus sp. EAC TaxID=1978338 RepID=UPI000B440B76|nr:DUF4430 domain-containing protein [Bacillus sp. EAC]